VTGAHHASELAFVFDTLKQKYGRDATERDIETARAMNSYLANFAISGDPNGSRNPNWSSLNAKPEQLLVFTMNKGPVMQEDPWGPQLDLIESTLDQKKVFLGLQ
jgi:para-nitrobenzyl esterase